MIRQWNNQFLSNPHAYNAFRKQPFNNSLKLVLQNHIVHPVLQSEWGVLEQILR